MTGKGISSIWFCTSFNEPGREKETDLIAKQYEDPTLCTCGARRDEHEFVDFGVYGGCPEKGCARFEEAK